MFEADLQTLIEDKHPMFSTDCVDGSQGNADIEPMP